MAWFVLLMQLHASPAAALSTLIGSSWRLKMDIGLEPGSYLARSDWGASGGRLRFNVDVGFEEAQAPVAEQLVGPLAGARIDRWIHGTFVSGL